MPRADSAQINIRSRYARERVGQLARQSGMTATQIIEEALRAYTPPSDAPPPAGLIRRGPLLILGAPKGAKTVTLKDAEDALAASRAERE